MHIEVGDSKLWIWSLCFPQFFQANVGLVRFYGR